MIGRNSLHYCYDVSYICWFALEEEKIYCSNLNSSNAVVCLHLHVILAYTVRLALINAAELERSGWFFFTFIEGCYVVIKKNIDEKLANRIRCQIWYKRCQRESLIGGPNVRRGSIAVSGFWPGVQMTGGPNPRGPKSAVTPERSQIQAKLSLWRHFYLMLVT